MERNKYSIKVRNEISTLAGWCDSAAAIEGAKMTSAERSALQQKLRDVVWWMDKKMGVV
jgi:hypothetical protein